MSLDAPEYPALPEYLRQDLDGRSVYSRPGMTRYATRVQISREEQGLLEAAGREGAPQLTREEAARYLGATTEELEAASRRRGHRSASRQLPAV